MLGITRHLPGCHRDHCSCEAQVRAWGGYINAALLAFIALVIGIRAYQRFFDPQEIQSLAMLTVAAIGGAMNVWQHRKLHGHGAETVRYASVLKIGAFIFAMELSVGLWSGSLALESDAWHVLVDNGAVIVSLVVASLFPTRADRDHITHKAMDAHILSDIVQSAAVVMAGVWILATGQYVVDSILSAIIAAVLFRWAFRIAIDSYRGSFGTHHHH